ncbi:MULTISPECIES: SusC/RagA family TonB-linked outer membrane protein [Niastella]|uniref:SusC/RagA family TonB-linked outer membrane protein n=1 Tax=Niastella soli TaxID=2821487 RepID=A0ABS3YMR8_9BACT|nr:SusC/RagA family TonB-linked outer membrane protein [Niastella soli]MBO9199189.1 SusC/RagA family TonB-linked outer membrane protein [Niastella soli]
MRKFLLLLLAVGASTCLLQAQTRTLTGRVTASDGSPIPNTSVIIKGTSNGTTTNADGMFSMSVPAGSRIIKFSAVGMNDVEVTIGDKGVINARMESAERNLAEVVVVGYGTQKRKEATGNVATVKGVSIADKPIQSFEAALGGRATGVQITVPNGIVNNPPVFRIRGTNSISLSSYPLVVIDGVPTFTGDFSGTNAGANALASINPSDIESIDIAKDAAASAIYGSRAANGVVFITTKKGKMGRARVSYDGWVGWTKVQRLPELLNAQEYTDFKNQGLVNAKTYNASTNYFALTNGPDGNPIDTRWYDYIYRTGISHSNSISVSGATESTNYYFSLGYTNQQGIVKRNEFRRKSVLFNIDHKVNSIISTGAKISYSNEDNLAAVSSGSLPGEAFNSGGLGRLAILTAPSISPYNNDGTYNTVSGNIGAMGNKQTVGIYNPVVSLDKNRSNTEINHVQANGYVQIKPLKWLTLKSLYGIDYLYADNQIFFDAISGEGYGTNGLAQSALGKNKRSIWTNTLSIDKSFGEDHTLGLLAGIEDQRTIGEGFGLSRQSISDPYFTNTQGGYTVNNPFLLSVGSNYLYSQFGRINYNFARKYYLSGNLRQDEFSGLGYTARKGVFWGVSAGWEITKEGFWTSAGLDKVFSSFKFRGSYGKVGNISGIGNYESFNTYSPGLYGGQPTIGYNKSGNPDLTWETSKKSDVGLNFGILGERITGEFSYYKNNIDGLVLDVTQVPSAGIPNAIRTNVGSMYNKGFEFGVNANIIQGKDFSWSTFFNVSINKNEVTALAPGLPFIIVTSPAGSTTNEAVSITQPGYSIGTLYLIPTKGVDQATGRRIFINADGKEVYYSYPTWQYADGTAAPAISTTDRRIQQNTVPKQIGGLENTFNYKNFELNVLLTYQLGFYVYYGTEAGLRDYRYWNNEKAVLRAWTKADDITDMPKNVFGDNYSNGSAVPLDIHMYKGDFLKLRNITLSYNMPKSVLERIKVNSARFYISGQNLHIWTKYPGPDPETSTNGNNAANQGIDRNQVANGRTVTLGLKLGL